MIRALATDEWMTPPEIVAALGSFDLDPCAPPQPRPAVARHHYSMAQDGLTQRWFGRVWLNPPYSNVAPWLARMAAHGRGTALVFSKTGADWFFASVWAQASALLFIAGRLRFLRPTGERATRDAGSPSVLVAYGIEDADRLEASGLAGAFVPLACVGQSIAVYRHDPPDISWPDLLRRIARRQGGRLTVRLACVLVANHPKAARNRHVDAKVRQVCQGPMFRRIAPGEFELREGAHG